MTGKSIRLVSLLALSALAVLLAAFLLLRNSKAEETQPRTKAQRELILNPAPEPDLDTNKKKGAALLLEVLSERHR